MAEKKKIQIKSDIRFNELMRYKKMFKDGSIEDLPIKLYLDKKPFKAKLKYGLVPKNYRYDRENKFKIYLNGVTSKKNEIDLIEKVNKLSPNQPLLLMEMLFFKEKQEIVKYDNSIEYYFTFLQY